VTRRTAGRNDKFEESGTAAGIYGFWLACAACVPQQSKLTHTLCGSRFLFCGNRLRLRLRATNLDLFSSSLSTFRHFDLQNAILKISADLIAIGGGRKFERAGEGAVLPLHAPEILAFLILLNLAFAINRQGVAVNVNVQVLLLDTRHFHF